MSLPKRDSVPALGAEGCPSVPVGHAVQPGTHVAITDGGGNGSTAACAHYDTLQPLRQKFLRLVADWGVLSRLETISASGSKDETSLFSSHELEKLQESLVEFLCDHGYSCSTAVPAYQPFLLDAWCALSTAVKDIDHILLEGVRAGILSPIPHSGIWDSVPEDEDADVGPFASSYTAVEMRSRRPQASKIFLDAGCRGWVCLHLARGFCSGQATLGWKFGSW